MRIRRWRWAGLALLCAIAASAWIADMAWPSAVPVLLRSGIENAVLCLLLLPFAHRHWRKAGRRQWAKIGILGCALLALPTIVAVYSAPQISAVAMGLIFTAVPAVVILAAAQSESAFGADGRPLSQLGMALAGMAGAALLLPFTLPQSVAGTGWLLAMILTAVLCGVAIVRLHRLLVLLPLVAAVTVIGTASGMLQLAFAFAHADPLPPLKGVAWAHEAAFFALIYAPLWVLTVWLVRDVEPRRFGSRFLLVPLLTVLEGVVLVRPAVDWTLLAGLTLMTFSAWRLLRPDDSPDAPLV